LPRRTFKLGTRASALARWQAEWVAERMQAAGALVELIPITTRGDAQQSGPIGNIGTQGVFTKELQRALLDETIDVAVHSLKDLPTEDVPGLALACVPDREAEGDVLVSRDGSSFEGLTEGAAVGTGSFRRRAQLLHARPDLNVQDIRGNVDTRLAKLDDGRFDAIVLAEAGLKRLELAGRITQVLPKTLCLPAVGQGALGIETRASDAKAREVLAPLEHEPTRTAVLAERSLLATLRGGCLAPVGAWGRWEEERLRLSAVVLDREGTERLFAEAASDASAALELGRHVAEELLSQGAADLIRASRDG